MNEPDCDVLIIGAGPTGLTLAHLLGQQGHRVMLVERHPARYPMPRAIVFDHEAARLFRRIGLAEQAASLGRPSLCYQWFNAEWRLLWEFDFSAPAPGGGALNYTFNQPALESAIEHALAARPTVEIRRGWQATALTQTHDGVAVTVQPPGAPARTVTARYLVGADGANSFVRQAAGIDWRDLGFCADWLVVDLRPHPGVRIDVPEAAQWCNPARPVTLVPGGGDDRRWEFMLLPGETWDDMQNPSRIWQLLSPWVRQGQADLLRHTVYRFRSALAGRWRAGRVLLAGDAAHLMPPFMGQGMCSGLRDAANLAWKLHAVLRGVAGEALLDSYELERAAQVTEIIALSVEMGQVACIADPAAAAARDAAFFAGHVPAAKPFPGLRQGLLHRLADGSIAPLAGTVSVHGQIRRDGVFAWPDDLAGSGALIVTAGEPPPDRLLPRLRSAGFWLHFDSAGTVQDMSGRYLAYLQAHRLTGFVVRPDGYVFGAATDWPTLEQLLTSAGLQIPKFA